MEANEERHDSISEAESVWMVFIVTFSHLLATAILKTFSKLHNSEVRCFLMGFISENKTLKSLKLVLTTDLIPGIEPKKHPRKTRKQEVRTC